ncbi:hypothetical protein C0R04_03150 [Streptomyces albidoflavus]|nr:hypothetical protein C0R04_03150 [Streptomyces albidoflavus]RZF02564.1 hypothetical protein C0R03_03150 [Streptomyces albidoflavus]
MCGHSGGGATAAEALREEPLNAPSALTPRCGSSAGRRQHERAPDAYGVRGPGAPLRGEVRPRRRRSRSGAAPSGPGARTGAR